MSVLGTEFKMNVHLEPIDGLHMSDYNFECAFFVFNDRRIVIRKSEMKKVDEDNYLAIIKTEDALKIGRGRIRAEITAFVPDAEFPDGLRTERLLICTDVIAR